MYYNYGKTKVKIVRGASWELERELQKCIDEIERDNGYVLDVKLNGQDLSYVGLIIYKCTDSYEQAKK